MIRRSIPKPSVLKINLAGFEGLTHRNITTMTRISPRRSYRALGCSKQSSDCHGERHDLSLDELIVLVEFDTNPEAVKALTVTALKDPNSFDHLVAGIRRDRDDRDAYKKGARQVTESGVRLVGLENVGPALERRTTLLTPEAHARPHARPHAASPPTALTVPTPHHPDARSPRSRQSPSQTIRLLHTCGIRGTVGLARGGR